MKRFDNVKMVLFDSTNASLKVSVEAQLTRIGPDGNYRDLVYTTDKGTSILNPNIYLTFAYKDENPKAVYTSYPQLFKIRAAFEDMKDRLLNSDAYLVDPNDNSMSVKQNYADPIVLSNIGKNNNWIQLKLEVLKIDENGIAKYTPGVSLQLSTSNGYTSLLSDEEFLTLYTIIKDLNLANIQCQISLAFLNTDPRVYNNYSQPSGYYQQQPPVYQPYQGQPQYPPQNRGNWAPKQPAPQPAADPSGYITPRYQNNGYQPKNSYRAPTPAAPAPSAPVAGSQPTQQAANNLPPRGNKPLMNMKAIDETPVNPYDVDDKEALNNVFNEIFSNNSDN